MTAVAHLRPAGLVGCHARPARQWLVAQVGHAHAGPADQPVSGRQHRHLAQGEQVLGVEPAQVVVRVVQERHVGAALPEHAGLLADAADEHVHRDRLGVGPVGGEDLGQQAGVAVRLEHHGQRRAGPAGAPRPVAGRGQRVQCLVPLAQQHLAGRGERDPAGGALHQGHAQPPFDLADRSGQRRLGDAQAFGCPAEVQFLGHGHEVPQLARVQLIHTVRVSVGTERVFPFFRALE